MAVNDQAGQVAVADELEACARTLAHSTRQVLVPSESYTLLADLTGTVDQLAHGCRQLAGWHARVVDGVDYAGEDPRGDGATGTITAAVELDRAAAALDTASTALRAAHTANSVIRWAR